MVTAIWMFFTFLFLLVCIVFVGAAIHHHWSVWADRKRAELEQDLPP